eukprot:sb/3471540/
MYPEGPINERCSCNYVGSVFCSGVYDYNEGAYNEGVDKSVYEGADTVLCEWEGRMYPEGPINERCSCNYFGSVFCRGVTDYEGADGSVYEGADGSVYEGADTVLCEWEGRLYPEGPINERCSCNYVGSVFCSGVYDYEGAYNEGVDRSVYEGADTVLCEWEGRMYPEGPINERCSCNYVGSI